MWMAAFAFLWRRHNSLNLTHFLQDISQQPVLLLLDFRDCVHLAFYIVNAFVDVANFVQNQGLIYFLRAVFAMAGAFVLVV
jgi:hypothetical protein